MIHRFMSGFLLVEVWYSSDAVNYVVRWRLASALSFTNPRCATTGAGEELERWAD
jgi:hypothetical protein